MFVGPLLDLSGTLLEEKIADTGFVDHYRTQWHPWLREQSMTHLSDGLEVRL